jgi:hypothetical protein
VALFFVLKEISSCLVPAYTGEYIFEVTVDLPREEQEAFAWSSGGGDQADTSQGWGVNNQMWLSYPSRYVKGATLVSAPGCQ